MGATLPVLFGLADSFAERRQRELHEHAVATALAHHDPENVGALIGGDQQTYEEEDSEFEKPVWAGRIGDGE